MIIWSKSCSRSGRSYVGSPPQSPGEIDDSVVDEPSRSAWKSSSLALAVSLVTCCQTTRLLADPGESDLRAEARRGKQWGVGCPSALLLRPWCGGGSTAWGHASPRASWSCCRGQKLNLYLLLHPVLLRRPWGSPGECKCDLGPMSPDLPALWVRPEKGKVSLLSFANIFSCSVTYFILSILSFTEQKVGFFF